MGKVWHNFRQFLASKKGQTLFNILYSWGAAVVIWGAMFKIMHFQGGNEILMIGMIVEIIVFIAAGFDYTSNDANEVGANALSGVILGGASSGDSSANINTSTPLSGKSGDNKSSGSSGGGSSVVVIGGGSGGSSTGGNNVAATSGANATSPVQGGGVVYGGGGNAFSGISGGTTSGAGGAGVTPEYAQSLSNTAQNLDEFSNTIYSLNEVSQKLLGAYKNITETQGFADNLATLNQNVSGLNDVFNNQLQTITEQMSAIKYINDSLQRMRNLYDGAIGDSYMFREESAKMTKHIEALNNVYARLLQAMTSNNNNNMNHNNF